MKIIIISILSLVSIISQANTNYIYYNTQDNKPQIISQNCTYDINGFKIKFDNIIKGMPLPMSDQPIPSMEIGGINWLVMNLALTTDPIEDLTDVSTITLVKLLPLTTEEKQSAKPLLLKLAENKFMDVCEQLTGQKVKLGFDEIQTIIEPMQTSNPTMFVALSIRLLAIDSELKREGGVKWWDDCTYHPEVEGIKTFKKSKYTLKVKK